MTAKQYLSQVERLNKMISNKLSEIYQVKSMALNISVLNEKDKVQTSGSKDRIGDMVSKMVDLEKEAQEYVNTYTELRRKVIMQKLGEAFLTRMDQNAPRLTSSAAEAS